MSRLLLPLLLLQLAAAAADPWPPALPGLIDEAGLEGYLAVLNLALTATKLSYTATWGSYHRDKDENATLAPGWKRLRELEKDPEAGFRGLVFLNEGEKRAVLALRGTDLDSKGSSGLADTCANKMLWENVTYEELPGECHSFPAATLDYFAACLAFAKTALASFPGGTQALLVGHSLGAGLAMLTAASPEVERRWHPSALGISAPAFVPALRRRVGREPKELDRRKLATIYNTFDPLYHNGGSLILGPAICTFVPPEPAACGSCYGPDKSQLACDQCFMHTHVLKRYLTALNGTTERPPAYRPHCGSAEVHFV